MKRMVMITAVAAMAVISSCGMGADEKNKVIGEAAKLRAGQVCQGDGSLETYGEKLDWMNEQLAESGITSEEDLKAASAKYDEEIKKSCPDKMPK